MPASGGNARRRSATSKARMGERLHGPQHQAKPAASLSCLPSGGSRESRARSFGAKAMEAVKSLERSREELPGVEGVERAEGGGGNWGGPPRPMRACVCLREEAGSYNR